MGWKKVMSLALSAAMVFSLAACSADTVSQGEKRKQPARVRRQKKRMMGFLMKTGFQNRANFLSARNL